MKILSKNDPPAAPRGKLEMSANVEKEGVVNGLTKLAGRPTEALRFITL
jgi:hypothetical protein